MEEVSLDGLTAAHLDEHHVIDRRSSRYFQPFKGGPRWWVSERYPSTGLQTVNTQTFLPVFLHPRGSRKWGFEPDYLANLERLLMEQSLAPSVPADALAVWLYKSEFLENVSDLDGVVERFFRDFSITPEERETIFSARSFSSRIGDKSPLTELPIEMTAVVREFPRAPDVEQGGGKSISSVRVETLGPLRKGEIEFGSRLTVVTGDNGLGKSFLLDFAWWIATNSWAERPALPHFGSTNLVPRASYTMRGSEGEPIQGTATYGKGAGWSRSSSAPTIEALAVYSLADGSFAVSDPARSTDGSAASQGRLSKDEVWNGRVGVIEGLIRDWAQWCTASDPTSFDQLKSVLRRLSPEDLGALEPGPMVRLPNDVREIPTIRHRYGEVPVTYASSGVQRVLLLAYLVIWAWKEHEYHSQRSGRSPMRRMLVVVDELEAHLHPKWQRIVLPALMKVGDLLSKDLALQVVAATHSPMILASLESTFDEDTDRLYHLFADGASVSLEQTPFVKYGDASGWLTSPLFGLSHARSREAEAAIDAAKSLQLATDPPTEEVAKVSEQLKRHLDAADKFWPRWLFFAEQHGVRI